MPTGNRRQDSSLWGSVFLYPDTPADLKTIRETNASDLASLYTARNVRYVLLYMAAMTEGIAKKRFKYWRSVLSCDFGSLARMSLR